MPLVDLSSLSFPHAPTRRAIRCGSFGRIAAGKFLRFTRFGARCGAFLAFAVAAQRVASAQPASGSGPAPSAPSVPTSTATVAPPNQTNSDYFNRFTIEEAEGRVTVEAKPQSGDFDQPPRAIGRVTPDYPGAVLGGFVAGDVRLELLVDSSGEPRQPRVSESPHPECEAAAVEAALKWKFQPAMKNGQPVAARFDLVFHFKGARTNASRGAGPFKAPATSPKNYPAEYHYDKAPVVKLAAGAVYPIELAAKKQAGSATLVFLIDPLGHTRRIEVREATQPEFGAAAAAMLAAWQFTPAKKDGKPTWTMLAKKHTFDLREGDSIPNESAARLIAALEKNPASILEGARSLDAPLKPRYQVAPAIPEALAAAGVAADAEVEIIIDRNGRVQWPRVVSATREDFGWAAATAVARWQFAPPTQQGKPVDVRVRVPLGYEPPAKKAK